MLKFKSFHDAVPLTSNLKVFSLVVLSITLVTLPGPLE